MSTRYERIKKFDEKLWAKGSAITINKGALLKDNVKDVNVLQLELENISNNIITAVEMSIECANISNEVIYVKEFTYLDLNVSSDSVFGAQIPIQIDNKEAREFLYTIKKIHFKNSEVIDTSLKMKKISSPQGIDTFGELKDEFIREVNNRNSRTKTYYKPFFGEEFWYCTCGRLNENEDNYCGACNISKDYLQEIVNSNHLMKRNEEYLAQLREKERIRLEEERLAREAKNKKIKKIVLIASLLAALVVGVGALVEYVFLPMLTYNKAVNLLSERKYQEAEDLFVTLDTYKESSEKVSLSRLLAENKRKITNADIQSILNTATDVRVLYDTNGGVAQEESVFSSQNAEMELALPKYEGYNFVEWQFDSWKYISAEDCVEVYVKAVWDDLFLIQYELDGGSADNKTEYRRSGDTFTLINPTKEGYSFIGWTGTDLNELTETVMIESGSYGDKIYVANWKLDTYSLKLDAAGGEVSGTVADTFTINDLPITLPDATNKTGCKFAGWYTSDGKKIVDSRFDIAANVTLTALWNKVDYKITYHLDGGKNSLSNRSTYNLSEQDIILEKPTRTGYKFVGWYSDSDFKNKVTKISAGSYGDISLYAKWEVITYTIEYVLGGGKVLGTVKKSFTVNDLPIKLPDAEKSNEVFLGWSDGSVDGKTIDKISDCKNYKLYASYMVPGLRLELSNDKTYYVVRSYAGYVGNVVIPAYYKNLPVKGIGYGAFASNMKITSISIPSTVKEIGDSAFKDCSNLQSVNIAEGVEEIGMESFYDCESLALISLPSTIKKIGRNAFSYCEKLKRVKMEEGLEGVGWSAFSGCISLEEITIPKSVKVLESHMFSGCRNLKTVKLQEGLEKICINVFENCTSLKKIIIPESVIVIEAGDSWVKLSPFEGCNNLTIYCRAKVIPEGWELYWNALSDYNDKECSVVWGYTGN